MKLLLTSLLSFFVLSLYAQSRSDKIAVLIVDGQNNHQAWPKTTLMMKDYLENTGKFTVEVARTQYLWNAGPEAEYLDKVATTKGEDLKEPKADPDFSPKFSDYDVILSNFGWKAADWPEKTQQAFEKFIKKGGGFVSVHAADNSFPEWEAYNEMIGIGGWGGRNENWGPYVYYNKEGERVEDNTPGAAGRHGKRESFEITLREAHPVTEGMPEQWQGAVDECYAYMRGPAKHMTILATGEDLSREGGKDYHAPVLMAIDYGKGRIFHTTLGHDVRSMEGVGFITALLRGTEWAATGKVTIPVPEDFPQKNEPSAREFTE